jgi:hypothetical protein
MSPDPEPAAPALARLPSLTPALAPSPTPPRVAGAAAETRPMADARAALAREGFVFLPAAQAGPLLENGLRFSAQDWTAFQDSWNRLERDRYMADGGSYRERRHATYSAPASGSVRQETHRPHYQSLTYNPLNGGIARHFAPIEPEIAQGLVLDAVLSCCRDLFDGVAPVRDWHIEVHQFRIDAARSGATPTPEGVHRDGVAFVFMMLVQRLNIQGGETRIQDPAGQSLARFTLADPFDTAIVNDARVLHGVTPVSPLDSTQAAWRDMLVVTFAGKPADTA